MSDIKKQLLQELSDAVVEMDEDKAIAASESVVANEIDAYEAIDKGLAHGMMRANELFEQDKYFVPEILLCSDAMYAGINVLKPHIKTNENVRKAKVVIGVVEGDAHDIGKNLVKIMLETAGFEAYDLGRDVPIQAFVDKAKEIDADLIALSTLMTTSMDNMGRVIKLLEAQNVRDRFRVIIGGAPISQGFADKIGADGYADNAAEAIKLARRLITTATAGEGHNMSSNHS